MRARLAIMVAGGFAAALASAAAFAAASPPPSSPPPAESWPTVPPFTAPTTTTTAPPVDPSSTTTTTTLSPAAQTPVVTLVPLGPEEQAVVDALYEARVVFVEAQLDPDAPGLDARLDATHARSGQARGIVEQFRAELRETGLQVRLSEELPWQLVVESVTFYADPYPNADVVACYIDTLVLLQLAAAPDGSDAILNDEIAASRGVFTLVPEEGRWQLWHAQSLSETFVGAAECVAD